MLPGSPIVGSMSSTGPSSSIMLHYSPIWVPGVADISTALKFRVYIVEEVDSVKIFHYFWFSRIFHLEISMTKLTMRR